MIRGRGVGVGRGWGHNDVGCSGDHAQHTGIYSVLASVIRYCISEARRASQSFMPCASMLESMVVAACLLLCTM